MPPGVGSRFLEMTMTPVRGTISTQRVYPADTHTASLLLYVSTWAILDKKTQEGGLIDTYSSTINKNWF
jgi:hypothetical protein